MDKKKWRITLFAIFINAFLCSFVVNEINLEFIRNINPENVQLNTKSLVWNSTVWSVDNEWYLPYAENLLNGEGFTSDVNEPEMRVRRTPVYPLFYSACYYLFGEQYAHFFIRYIQLFLFALSAVLIAIAVKNLFKNERWAKFTGVIYGLNVFIFSFNYFTLTEGLTPFLIVLSIYVFSVYVKNKKVSALFICGLAIGLAFLCRATSGVIIVAFGTYLLLEHPFVFKQKIIKSLVLGFGFLCFISPWVLRNYLVTGELIIAEKYYHGATMTFGRSHIKLRELVSTWTNPANLSAETFSNTLLINERDGRQDENRKVIENYLDQWPTYIFEAISRSELENNLIALSECFREKEELKAEDPKVLRKEYLNLSCEDKVYAKLSAQKDSIIQAYPFRYYVLTPITSIKELVFNSYVHHFPSITILSKYYRIPGLIIKSLVFLFHVLLYASAILFLFFKQVPREAKALILIPVVILMVALTEFLFRYIESRYLIPVYPFLTISFSFLALVCIEKSRTVFKRLRS